MTYTYNGNEYFIAFQDENLITAFRPIRYRHIEIIKVSRRERDDVTSFRIYENDLRNILDSLVTAKEVLHPEFPDQQLILKHEYEAVMG